jgi:hypothetical protein
MARTRQAGQVKVIEIASGEESYRWPVDARELVKSKAFQVAEGETFSAEKKAEVAIPLPAGKPGDAPGSKKVILYHKTNGSTIERWPVDARELVAGGEWTTKVPGTEDETLVSPEGSPEEVLALFKSEALNAGYREDAANAIAKERFDRHFNGEPQLINPALLHGGQALKEGEVPTEYAPGVPLVVARQGSAAVGGSGPATVTRR